MHEDSAARGIEELALEVDAAAQTADLIFGAVDVEWNRLNDFEKQRYLSAFVLLQKNLCRVGEDLAALKEYLSEHSEVLSEFRFPREDIFNNARRGCFQGMRRGKCPKSQ